MDYNFDEIYQSNDLLVQQFSIKIDEYLNFVKNNNDFLTIENFHKQWSQQIKTILEDMKNLSLHQKKIIAPIIMNGKKYIDNFFNTKKIQYHQSLIDIENNQPLDINIFENQLLYGSLHPLKSTILQLTNILNQMGFCLKISSLMTTEQANFDDLNFPPHHPARDMQDTFFLSNNKILRTHTSTTQIEVLKHQSLPIKIFSLGKVFRNEAIDATHNCSFYQMEVMYINEDANVLSLRGTIEKILKNFFNNEKLQIRFRSSFFPFTTPSFEIDLLFNNCWLEIGGCGIIHTNVMNHIPNNNNNYIGFAIGFGIDRLHMIKNNIQDIRDLYIYQNHLYSNTNHYFITNIIKNFYNN
jgi:phenylalanyl-tRNA synthetase alpha chain